MLSVNNLMKSYSASKRRSPKEQLQFAVDGVSFEVEKGDLVTLVGPSGCGKTTTLRSIAGLEQPDGGSIQVGGKTVYSEADRINVSANDRDLSMVFQSYAIWPHMDVYHNVSFPLDVNRRANKISGGDIRKKVENALEAVELAHYRDRPATNLSGGQQQRLAVARAMVTEPEVILLDEPLSNLDAKLRESMRLELKRMQRDSGITMLYVTHDQQEALALSTSVAVMNNGKIVQYASPREVYSRPKTRFVADFIGTSNFIPGTILSVDGSMSEVATEQGSLWSSTNPGLSVGDEVSVSIRPEDIGIDEKLADSAGKNCWSGSVLTRAFLGEFVDHVVRVGNEELRCRTNPNISISADTSVHVTVHPDSVLVLPADS